MEKKLFKILISLIAIVLLSSCGVLFYGSMQKVNLNSSPSGADVYINGSAANRQTPCEVNIKRKVKATQSNKKNQYNYVFKKDGYEDYLVTDNAKFNYVTILDMPYYAVPYLVDAIAGSQWKYNKQLTVNLAPSTMAITQNTQPLTFRSQEAETPQPE
ncbi:MAG: hypothetical protein ABSA76_03670, partial [Bacteroidales bacterium]